MCASTAGEEEGSPLEMSTRDDADLRQIATTMLLALTTIVWTAIYCNSDSTAAAVLPLLLGAGILKVGPPINWQPRTAFIAKFCRRADIHIWKQRYSGLAWLVTVGVSIAVCVILNEPVRGVETNVQLAAPDSEVSILDGYHMVDTRRAQQAVDCPRVAILSSVVYNSKSCF